VRRRRSVEREPAAASAPSARELALAEQLAATGEILRIVSTMGPGSRVEPVLEAIVATAARLCGAEFALAYVRKADGLYHTVAANRADAELVRYAVEHPLSPGPGSLIGRATLEGGPVHVEDCLADPDYAYPEFQRIGRFRTMLGVPLMRDGLAVGALGLLRSTVSPFSQAQIELVTTFADQAVIAIENVRLFQEVRARTDELGEALRQQTATADVLKVISRSTFNLEAVLDTLVESATRLCDADHSWLFLRDGDFFRWAASFGHGTEVHERIKAYFKPLEVPVNRGSITGRAALEGRLVHVPDVLADPDYTWSEAQHIGGYRAAIGVPLFREGTVIGVIFVAKCLPEPFSASQMELVTTFADQAVIAIENVRLFDEVQARTRELEEALEYQTATGDVLNVISRSPAQIQPVLDAIVETARRLCDAYDAVILLREGEFLSVASHRGPIPVDIAKWPISRGWVTGRAIVDGKPMHVADLQAAAEEFPDGHAMAMRQGHRTLLATPLLREEVAIGAIVIRRTEVRPFSEKQIAVLQTFADQAVIAIENARLFEEVQTRTAELQESLEYQTATSEVLNVISRSPSDIQPVLDAIAETAQRLCQAENVFIMRERNGLFHLASHRNASPEQVEFLTDHPLTPDRSSVCGRVALERRTIHLPDCLADPEYELRQSQKLGNYRATLGIPLLRDGFVLGVIILTRSAVHSFAEKQIELVETFADQAVIAIENVRLFDEVNARTAELAEALGYQTATSDVLNVISRSPSELQPVLEAIVQTAAGLCSAEYAFIAKCDGEICELVAANRMQAEHIQYLARKPIAIDRGSVTGRVALEHSTVHIVDVLADPDFKHLEWQRVGRQRTVLGVPLMREGVLLGAILLARTEVAPFSDKQIELVTTFADQAVIAIENARLFEEVQTRTAELTEALEQQTATSEVLQVISRSAFDLQTVLDTLVQSAARLGDADIGTITRQRDGSFFREALYGFSDEFIEYVRAIPVRPEKGNISGRALLEGKIVQIEDVERDPDYTWDEAKRTGRYRTLLGVPLVRHGKPIGVMALGRREVRPFNQREIDLVTTFADQAVIAIENVRLFDEVQARTRDLEELLQQQTATAEVLKVISRSTFELQPVLDTLVESAARLCEADMAAVARQTGTAFHYAATFGYSPELKAYLVGIPHTPGAGSIIGRTLEGGSTVHVADVLADPNYRLRDVQEKAGYRTVLCVPLLRERTPIGVVVLTRRAVRPFTDKQIELVTTFADQAVIAIENVRLFDEVQARTGELAKSVGELQALGEVSQAVNSTLDLETVLKTIVAKAVQLSATDAGAIYVFSKLRQKFRLRATYGMSDAMIAEIGKQGGVRLGESYIGAAAESGQAVQVPDLMTEAASPMRDLILGAGYRGLLAVPLLRPGGIVGALVVRRKEPGAFPASTIDLLQTFAAQSVVAIQNARLFEDVEARTRELAKSLEELRAAQERLIQTEKLASLGQLTAGIAHEIKNPLNFVNNFAALSIELIDELKDAIRSTPLDEEQAAELMALLAGNLGKVVQHGKRADSIVKNMLLHSRAGSGERRVADINLLVEESLNLAYHGARAEKQGFNVTIERSLDPSAGEVDVLPQEITRVFLNLISNGFYATVKRKERASAAYEPILLAATRNLGDRVEIRIRDNGTGIPPEVKEKMFDPFFTTKPAGEGTGLGLSLSHDIVVKQHRGSIEVDTSPGEYTEFRSVLPRAAASPANDEVRP